MLYEVITLFAPVEEARGTWNFRRSREFIVEKFAAFAPDMGEFASRAFENRWLDTLPREGKVGGAYCTSFPLTGESRILCNFV